MKVMASVLEVLLLGDLVQEIKTENIERDNMKLSNCFFILYFFSKKLYYFDLSKFIKTIANVSDWAGEIKISQVMNNKSAGDH